MEPGSRGVSPPPAATPIVVRQHPAIGWLWLVMGFVVIGMMVGPGEVRGALLAVPLGMAVLFTGMATWLWRSRVVVDEEAVTRRGFREQRVRWTEIRQVTLVGEGVNLPSTVTTRGAGQQIPIHSRDLHATGGDPRELARRKAAELHIPLQDLGGWDDGSAAGGDG